MRSSIHYILIFSYTIILMSCAPNNSCEGTDLTRSGSYDLSEIFLTAYEYSNGIRKEILQGQTIKSNNIEFIVTSEQVWPNNYRSILGFILSSANACSVAAPYGSSNVTEYKVFLVNTLNEDVDVSDYFNVNEWNGGDYTDVSFPVSVYSSYAPPVAMSYLLHSDEMFNITGEYKLKVTLSTSSGKSLSSTIGPFIFINYM